MLLASRIIETVFDQSDRHPVFIGVMCLLALAIVAVTGRGLMLPAGPGLNGLDREIMFMIARALGGLAALLAVGAAAWRTLGS